MLEDVLSRRSTKSENTSTVATRLSGPEKDVTLLLVIPNVPVQAGNSPVKKSNGIELQNYLKLMSEC